MMVLQQGIKNQGRGKGGRKEGGRDKGLFFNEEQLNLYWEHFMLVVSREGPVDETMSTGYSLIWICQKENWKTVSFL